MQYCQDTVAGRRQTWHSAEGKAQLEIAPSATVQLVHCSQKLMYAALTVRSIPWKCLRRCCHALNAMSSVVVI